MAIETPEYEVLKKNRNIEIRQYPGYIQAEAEVPGQNYRSAIETGFNILAGYIFGNNTSRKKIDMTSPVKTSVSEKIPMTSPVKISGKYKYKVAFIMPSRYSLGELPVPGDKRIGFREILPHKMAVIRFSGFFNEKRINDSIKKLVNFLQDEGIDTEGEYIIAGYNPPWIPGFLARNEVMAKIRE